MKKLRPGSPGLKISRHFGLHLTLDGYLASRQKLNDMALVAKALKELPERLGMQRLTPPYVVEVASNNKKDPGGYSGFVIIQESHISIHTFPSRRFVSIDVYSCRDFDPRPIRRYFRRIFSIRKLENHLIIRGTEYPMKDFI